MGRRANTLIYVRKNYVGHNASEKQFQRDVEDTQEYAYSVENHIEKLQAIYPDYTIIPLYTYEHGEKCIETYKRCQWDSSLNGMAAFKNREDLDKKLIEINKKI